MGKEGAKVQSSLRAQAASTVSSINSVVLFPSYCISSRSAERRARICCWKEERNRKRKRKNGGIIVVNSSSTGSEVGHRDRRNAGSDADSFGSLRRFQAGALTLQAPPSLHLFSLLSIPLRSQQGTSSSSLITFSLTSSENQNGECAKRCVVDYANAIKSMKHE